MKQNTHYATLLFDADGTLFDYTAAELYALKETQKALGLEAAEAFTAVYKEINHGIWQEFERGEISVIELKTQRFSRLFQSLARRIPNGSPDAPELLKNLNTITAQRASDCYLSFLGRAGHLIPGAFDLLTTLENRFRLVLVTNGLAATQRGRLEASGIGRFFEAIVISEELGVQKPDPAFFAAMEQLLASPLEKERTLIIGDSMSSDMLGGINYGIDTCWYNPMGAGNLSQVPVTHEVSSYAELLTILEQ